MRTLLIRALTAALLAVVALPGNAHADGSRFDARALATSSDALLAEPALGSEEVAELVAGEVYPARSQLVPGANGWLFVEVQVDGTTGYALEGVVAVIPAEGPVPEDLTKRALVTSGGPVHAYPHPDSAPVGVVSTGDTLYVDPDAGVEVSHFLTTETLIPAETTDGAIGWVPDTVVQIVGERGDEEDAAEPSEEPATDTPEPAGTAEPADEVTDEPGDDAPAPADEEVPETGSTEEAFTVLGRELTDPVLLGGAAGALLIAALGWAALRRRGGGRGAGAAASVPMTAPVVVESVAEPEEDIEELIYDGDDEVEELVYDVATPTTARDKDRFEF